MKSVNVEDISVIAVRGPVEPPPVEYVRLLLPVETATALAYALGPLIGKQAGNSGLFHLWRRLCDELGIDCLQTLRSLEVTEGSNLVRLSSSDLDYLD